MTKLKVTSSDGTSYSGDLLAMLDVLKNMTEIFRRAYYSPSSADMRVRTFVLLKWLNVGSWCDWRKIYSCKHLLSPQNFVQSLSNMLMEENRDRWEEAQLVGVSFSSSSM